MTTQDPEAPWRGKEWESGAEAADKGLRGQGYIVHAVMQASRVGRWLAVAAIFLAALQAGAAIVTLLSPLTPGAAGPAGITVIRGAESWQFFAFIFAAVVALAFTLIDELPVQRGGWRATIKVGAFLVVGYLTLLNPWVRNVLALALGVFKGLESR